MAADALPATLRARLSVAWQGAKSALAVGGCDESDFAAAVLAAWEHGRTRRGLGPDLAALEAALPRMHLQDFYLARCCEAGDAAAWQHVLRVYRVELARSLRGACDPGEAEQVASAVLADAALPPPRGGSRTLLGNYEGGGPLWAWFATIALRRVRREASRPERSLEVVGTPPGEGVNEDPEVESTALAFRRSLSAAWDVLDAQESLALVLKHREGRTQREIARLFGTSAPTVTRIVQGAVAKLRGRLEREGALGLGDDPELWTRLEAAIASHLETLEPPTIRTQETA